MDGIPDDLMTPGVRIGAQEVYVFRTFGLTCQSELKIVGMRKLLPASAAHAGAVSLKLLSTSRVRLAR